MNKESIKINIGDKFGDLIIVEDLGMMVKNGTKSKRHYYRCCCSCGKDNLIIYRNSLVSGHTISCGEHYTCRVENEFKPSEDGMYMIGKTSNGTKFYVDTEDVERIKGICWNTNSQGYITGHSREKKKKNFVPK